MTPHKAGEDTLGPLLRAVMKKVWTELLFVQGSSVYLPDLIRNGDPSRGIRSYDPAMINGKQPPIAVSVPQNTRDMACTSLDYPVVPIGKGDPTLTVEDLKLVNLHAVSRVGDITFPPGNKVEGTVSFGALNGQALPLTLESKQAKAENYEFNQVCCVPGSEGSTHCVKTYTNRGTGYFVATISQATGSATITIDTKNLCVQQIDEIKITIPPKNLDIEFTVDQDGGDIGKEGMLAFAKAAVQTGIAHDKVEEAINNLLDSTDLKENMTKIINQAIRDILPSVLKEMEQ